MNIFAINSETGFFEKNENQVNEFDFNNLIVK